MGGEVPEDGRAGIMMSRRFTTRGVMSSRCLKATTSRRFSTRVIRQRGVRVENRVMATRILLDEGRAVGALGFNVRTGEFVVIRAKAVILACGACGRLGLPASGYLMGTYENPANAGDGYAMAYHAGAELTNIECFQVNPLLKDYNGPACAYVSGPFGGYTVNAKGNRFMLSDYWSGQMMWEFYRELHSENGPVYLKMDHLAPETVNEIEQILHTTERPSRGRFHAGRGVSYGNNLIEMSISEIGLCSGHSASGVWINERGETTVPGLYAAGDMASVPHGYMLGAFEKRSYLRVGVFAGVHGDEESGIHAAVQLLERLHADPERARGYELFVYPVCNPWAYVEGSRWTRSGLDLNRLFWTGSSEPEVEILERQLRNLDFNGIIALHSDDTSEGLYGFVKGHELTRHVLEPALGAAGQILRRNFDKSIDNFEANNGIIEQGYDGILSAPPEQKPRPFEIVFETPHHAAFDTQVEAHIVAVQTILDRFKVMISEAQDI